MSKKYITEMSQLDDFVGKYIRGSEQGTILLAEPVINPVTLRNGRPSMYALVLGKNTGWLQDVLNGRSAIAVSRDENGAHIMSFDEVREFAFEMLDSRKQGREYTDRFLTGPDALKILLDQIDLEEELEKEKVKEKKYIRKLGRISMLLDESENEVCDDMSGEQLILEEEALTNEYHREFEKLRKCRKRIEYISLFLRTGTDSILIREIDILPPQIRAVLKEKLSMLPYTVGNDIADSYREVLVRNLRLEKLYEIGAPGIVIIHEKKMLQAAVNDLVLGEKWRTADGEDAKEHTGAAGLADLLTASVPMF